ncbi:hypothetical protein Hypma_011183 [Hypsizygus marmoreus]|uniref:Uncharacterized protein n=1 Tax=Hypsizygus marmoreus TaxID=39966 RepID=A0A369JQC6_HYPMA|nr:hypothetical protein Hypma_011183 [Hypsizygus marmoreus]
MESRRILGASSSTVNDCRFYTYGLNTSQSSLVHSDETGPIETKSFNLQSFHLFVSRTASKLEPTSNQRADSTQRNAHTHEQFDLSKSARSRRNTARIQGFSTPSFIRVQYLTSPSVLSFNARIYGGHDVDLRASSVSKPIAVVRVTSIDGYHDSLHNHQTFNHRTINSNCPYLLNIEPTKPPLLHSSTYTTHPPPRAIRHHLTRTTTALHQRSNTQTIHSTSTSTNDTRVIYDDAQDNHRLRTQSNKTSSHGNDTREILRARTPPEAGSMHENDEGGGWESACDRAPRHERLTQTTTPSRRESVTAAAGKDLHLGSRKVKEGQNGL